MTTKQKILNMVEKLPDDVSIEQILNRLLLLKKIKIALAEASRGEGMEHDLFFKQLQEEDEKENKNNLAAPRTKGSQGNKKVHHPRCSKNRTKIRPKD